MRLRWTGDALEDFKSISAFIEQSSGLGMANRVCRNIYNRVQTLRRFPSSGRVGLREHTRELVVGRYVVVYRVHSNTAEILRIWHAAQDRN